jgi:hypothetical protein
LLCERKPLVDREGMALPRGAADENNFDAVALQMFGLLFDDGQIQSAIRVKRGVSRRNQAAELKRHPTCS